MQDFFKSWRFRVIVALLVVVAAVMLHAAASGGMGTFLSNALGTVTAPIMRFSTRISDSATQFLTRMANIGTVYEQNELYREQINELNRQLVDYETAKRENEQYRDFLDLKEKNTDFTFEACAVIGRDPEDRFHSFIIDAGSLRGLELNDPVITADGLVGVIAELGTTYAKVITILDPGLNIGSYDIRTADTGVCNGTIALAEQGLLKMKYLPRETGASAGDLIVTSGGGIFPRDLIIGTIEVVLPEDSGVSYYAEIRPQADLINVKNVFVITSFEGQGSMIDDENLLLDQSYLEWAREQAAAREESSAGDPEDGSEPEPEASS